MVDAITFEGEFEVTDAIKRKYEDDGFIVVKGLLDKEELEQIEKLMNHPDGIMRNSYTTIEPDDKKIVRIMYRHPGNDVSGILSRSEKIVNACEKLLEGEVYHYHAKFIMKNPKEGGSHVWHQDYGYWYAHNLFPYMITVWIPLDKATKENSCLEVLKGSHKAGRIDHFPGAGFLQTQADLIRVEAIKATCPHLYCEMESGDVLFLHCNLLHKSSPNDSDKRRWAFIPCYNKASNNSFIKHQHASYTPLEKVPNLAVKSCTNYTDFSGKEFINPITKEEDRKFFPLVTEENNKQ